jgi:hypothetical protein
MNQVDPDLLAAVEWLRSFIPAADWSDRRAALLSRMEDEALSTFWMRDPSALPEVGGDLAGLMLFTGEGALRPSGGGWYDPMTGARYIPLLTSIGRRITVGRSIGGIDDRARRLMCEERSQADAGMFELLLALSYAEQGWSSVEFIPETKRRRLPDFTARRSRKTWSVEAKRMGVGPYREAERAAFQALFEPVARLVAERRRFVVVNVVFVSELLTVPVGWLIEKVERALRIGGLPLDLSDKFGRVNIRPILTREIDEFLKHDYLLFGDARFIELALGEYDWHVNHLVAGDCPRHRRWPRYVDVLGPSLVIGRWISVGERAVERRSRHFIRQLSDATDQLLDDMPGAVHVGLEALDGDYTEFRRDAKIQEQLATFDPREKPLVWIYCHMFRPLVPPGGGWTFDETTSFWRSRPHRYPHVLPSRAIIRPPGAALRTGGHWRHAIDRDDD